MTAYVVRWSSEGNFSEGTVIVLGDNLEEAQNNFWKYIQKQPIFSHMWNLSFKMEKAEFPQ